MEGMLYVVVGRRRMPMEFTVRDEEDSVTVVELCGAI